MTIAKLIHTMILLQQAPLAKICFSQLSFVFPYVLACLIIVGFDVIFECFQLLQQTGLSHLQVVHCMIHLCDLIIIHIGCRERFD